MLVSRKVSWFLLLVCAAAGIAAIAYPMYVIRPFRAQDARELSLALALQSWAPAVTAAAAIAAVALAALLWRRHRGIASRIAPCAVAALTVASAGMAQVNIFEMMFHRIDVPEPIPAGAAALEADDRVLAVQAGGQSRAYPIRLMGYHHIVNDRLGGIAVAATY